MDKQEIVAELRRVAEKLQASHISQSQFKKHSRIGISTVASKFGTWNQALEAAGLSSVLPGPLPELRQQNRWGSFVKARQFAYAKYGFPELQTAQTGNSEAQLQIEKAVTTTQIIVPQTYKPTNTQYRKKIEFGEPLDFRGLRFAPINEQGVVYLFGMISRELGFLMGIDSTSVI